MKKLNEILKNLNCSKQIDKYDTEDALYTLPPKPRGCCPTPFPDAYLPIIDEIIMDLTPKQQKESIIQKIKQYNLYCTIYGIKEHIDYQFVKDEKEKKTRRDYKTSS